jgi:2-methylcitrate dehydratase PrpD
VILAALEARRRIPSPRAITQIRIIGPIMPYVDRPRPSSGLEGKFSFQYAAACALTDGKVTVESFSDERCARPDVAALLAKVQFVQSPEIPASLDRMWVEFDVELASGEHVVTRCTKPKASWGEPIAEKEHLIKIRDCIGAVFDAATTERCITTLQRFDELDSRDIRRLIRSLGNFDAGGEH